VKQGHRQYPNAKPSSDIYIGFVSTGFRISLCGLSSTVIRWIVFLRHISSTTLHITCSSVQGSRKRIRVFELISEIFSTSINAAIEIPQNQP